MSYTSRSYIKTYTPSDDVLINDSPSVAVSEAVYTLKKQIKLQQPVGALSTYRFVFGIKQSFAGANQIYGKIYRNGIPIGSEFMTDGTNLENTCTQDIVTSNFIVGDSIELWCHIGGGAAGQCMHLQICGTGSEWGVII